MNNLFSVFDPSANLGLNLNWVSAALALFLIPSTFWIRTPILPLTVKNLITYINNEFKALLGAYSAPGLSLLPLSLLLFIIVNNFMGLFPFIFTASRHLTFTVTLALPLWVGHVIIGWVKETSHMLAHLVPLGTPPALIPFMVLIELVRNVIRPLTLAVRLAANIVAGHLLITLLSNQACGADFMIIFIIMTTLILLLTLERAVALIQSYVFSVLRTLYFSEVNFQSLT